VPLKLFGLMNVDSVNFVSFFYLENVPPAIFETGNYDTWFCY